MRADAKDVSNLVDLVTEDSKPAALDNFVARTPTRKAPPIVVSAKDPLEFLSPRQDKDPKKPVLPASPTCVVQDADKLSGDKIPAASPCLELNPPIEIPTLKRLKVYERACIALDDQ